MWIYGELPKGWTTQKIGDYATIITDYVANGSFASLAQNVTYKLEPDYAVLIRLTDYNNEYKGDFVYIDRHAYEFLAKSKLFGDEIIISNVGANVGIVFKCPKLDTKMSLAPNSIMLKTKGNDDFYYYWFISKNGQHSLQSIVTGSAQPKFNKTNFRDLEVPVPPMDVQNKIADYLLAIDNKISLNKQINDNLLQQCATLYDDICSTAEIALMSDLVAVVETGSRPKGGAQTSGIPSIGAEKIERFGTYDYSSEKFISEEYFSKLKRGIITSGDVLLYKDGAYTGKSSMALDGFPHVKCAVNEHVFIIRTLNKKYQYFLYFTLQNADIRKMIHGLACGKAAQPGLNQPELLSVSIKLPPKDVLEAFEEQVNPLMHQIALNALESKHLSALQDAILPKLMSGEIDVSSIELD